MDKLHKETLQVTKEIIVKFIEGGRVSPANFGEIFPSVYAVVRGTLVDSLLPAPPETRGEDDDDGE
ncbi:MAG: hypothetical protein LBV01_05940 [Deltaproteobacteria bacterium]|nr:hypothetical protein [Deltaproteobacteria bacterium]